MVKHGGLYLHGLLGGFLSTHFPNIKLATDIERREAIDELITSTSFQRTHAAVARLKEFSNVLGPGEIDELIEAGLNNSQISWIGSDGDVQEFFRTIIGSRFENYPLERQQAIKATFDYPPTEESEAADAVKDPFS